MFEKIEIIEIFVFSFSKVSINTKILKNPGWLRPGLVRVLISLHFQVSELFQNFPCPESLGQGFVFVRQAFLLCM